MRRAPCGGGLPSSSKSWRPCRRRRRRARCDSLASSGHRRRRLSRARRAATRSRSTCCTPAFGSASRPGRIARHSRGKMRTLSFQGRWLPAGSVGTATEERRRYSNMRQAHTRAKASRRCRIRIVMLIGEDSQMASTKSCSRRRAGFGPTLRARRARADRRRHSWTFRISHRECTGGSRVGACRRPRAHELARDRGLVH